MQAMRLVGAVIVAGFSAVATGAVVDVRILERTGQTVVTPQDNVLDLVVQVRAQPGTRVGGLGFSIRMPGEQESWGSLARSRISNPDGSYFDGIGVSNVVGLGGIARHFAYYANINSAFNGLLNQSGGSFVNTPDQEIGIVIGTSRGSILLAIPGIDDDGDGNPDSWTGNGLGSEPAAGATAELPPSVAGPYFADGQYIDFYRFRYTVTDLRPRELGMQFFDTAGLTLDRLTYGPGEWGFQGRSFETITNSFAPFSIPVVPSPGTIAVVTTLGAVALRRSRRT